MSQDMSIFDFITPDDLDITIPSINYGPFGVRYIHDTLKRLSASKLLSIAKTNHIEVGTWRCKGDFINLLTPHWDLIRVDCESELQKLTDMRKRNQRISNEKIKLTKKRKYWGNALKVRESVGLEFVLRFETEKFNKHGEPILYETFGHDYFGVTAEVIEAGGCKIRCIITYVPALSEPTWANIVKPELGMIVDLCWRKTTRHGNNNRFHKSGFMADYEGFKIRLVTKYDEL